MVAPTHNIAVQAGAAAPFGSGWSFHRYRWITRAVTPLDWLLPPRHQRAFGILTYHRVADRSGDPPLTVSPATFRRQISGLLARGFRPLPLPELVDRQVQGLAIPRNAFAIVFDDGYQGVATQAFPILRELRAPATVFVPTAYLDSESPFPFDPWSQAGADPRRADAWRPLTRRACREMLDSGWMTLGSHTHRHEDFRGREEDFASDLRESIETLRDFGVEAPTFSFPFGSVSDSLRRIAQAAGLRCCLTTDCQLVRPDDDPFAWGRFGAEEYDTPATLSAKLNGWYSWSQNLWRGVKQRLR